MESVGRGRGKGIRKQPAGCGKRHENAKKILNRGNEPKDLLKIQHLAFLRAKNEPKTNPISSAKMSRSKRKSGPAGAGRPSQGTPTKTVSVASMGLAGLWAQPLHFARHHQPRRLPESARNRSL